MTLGDMIVQGTDLLGETEGTQGAASPFAWKRNLKNAADTIARATHSVYRTFEMDLVAGQSDYCAPPLYHIIAGSVLDNAGNPHVLCPVKNKGFVPRDAAALITSGNPYGFAVLGANTVRLYATPSYGTTGAIPATPPAVQGLYGLVMEGYGVVTDLWDADGDECPLPFRGHLAAVYLATSQRAAQLKDYTAAQYYDGLHMHERGLLEAEAATITRPQSGRANLPGALSLSVLSSGGTAPDNVIDGGTF